MREGVLPLRVLEPEAMEQHRDNVEDHGSRQLAPRELCPRTLRHPVLQNPLRVPGAGNPSIPKLKVKVSLCDWEEWWTIGMGHLRDDGIT